FPTVKHTPPFPLSIFAISILLGSFPLTSTTSASNVQKTPSKMSDTAKPVEGTPAATEPVPAAATEPSSTAAETAPAATTEPAAKTAPAEAGEAGEAAPATSS